MRKKALLGLIITFALCMVAAGLIPLGKSYVSADSAGEDKTYYAPKTILSAGWWNSLTVNETENGTHIEFNGSNYVTIRTTSSVTYVADGLHLSIENFSGDGFGIAFSNMQGPDAYDAALRFFAFNNNDHTGVMRSSCPTWSNMEVLGTLATRPMNANFDIRLEKKADSSWNFIFDGQIFTVSAEKFASAITDPDHVYVSFTAYGGSNTIDSYSFDFVAIHDSSSKCAEDLTDDEKLLLKNVTEKIDAIGKVEVTPECYGKITAARGDYDALFDILKKMVKNYSTLKYAEQNYYVLTNALSFDEENVLMDMIVTTDNHLDTNDCTNYEDGSPQDRFNNMLSYASDKGVDAVLLLGDITDWARFDDSEGLVKARKQINMLKDSVEGYLSDDVSLFFTMGNHDSSDSEGEFRADLFYEVLGDAFYANDVNRSDPMWIRGFRHAKIGGLDFISISYDYTGELQNIQLDGVEWVKNKLKEITSAPDYTNEPIFLLSHVAFSNTVYGSGSRAEKPNKLKLYDVLAEYPQLVMLSGHSHFPVDNQTFIYQSDFTHVTAGATGYLDMIGTDFMTEGGYIVGSALIPYKHTTAQGLYLEVDKNYNIRVTRIDFNRGGRQIVDRVIIPAADLVNKTNLNYYTEARAERYPAPEFSANASLAADATSENSMEVTFDTIICDSVVQYYVIDIEDESGTRTFKSYAMNWIYPAFEDMPLSKTVKIDGYKASKPYSVTVTAVDSYGNESKPLTKIYVETPDEDERNAARVTGLIDAIGTVTEESGGAITNARAAYEALSYDAKKLVNNHGVLLSAINDYDKLFITFEQYFNIARTGRTVVGQNYWAGTGEMQYSNTEKGIMINYSHAMPNVRMGLKRFDLDGLHLKFDSLEKSPEMGAKYYPAIGILLGGTEHPIYTEPQKTSILLFLDTSTGRLEGHPGFKQIISDPALRYENLKNREWDIKFEKAESGDFVIEIAGKKGLIDKSFFDGSFTLTDTTKTYLSISCWIDDGSFSLRLMSAHDASSTCYGDDKVSFKQIEEIKQLDKEIGEIGKVTADSKAAIESAEARYNAVPERYKFMVTGANLLKEAREEYDRLSAVGSDGQASSAKSGGCKGGISGAESAMLISMILSAVSVTSLKKLKRR